MAYRFKTHTIGIFPPNVFIWDNANHHVSLDWAVNNFKRAVSSGHIEFVNDRHDMVRIKNKKNKRNKRRKSKSKKNKDIFPYPTFISLLTLDHIKYLPVEVQKFVREETFTRYNNVIDDDTGEHTETKRVLTIEEMIGATTTSLINSHNTYSRGQKQHYHQIWVKNVLQARKRTNPFHCLSWMELAWAMEDSLVFRKWFGLPEC
jgi:hypothetical protein